MTVSTKAGSPTWRPLLLLWLLPFSRAFTSTALGQNAPIITSSTLLFETPASATAAAFGQPTELPDSMEDGAQMAARACQQLIEAQGPLGRCRIDFDTSAGDETFPILKQSTEFMQNLVTSLCYLQFPKLMELRQTEMMRVVTAQNEIAQLESQQESITQQLVALKMKGKAEAAAGEKDEAVTEDKEPVDEDSLKQQLSELQDKIDAATAIVSRGGVDPDYVYDGPIARIYMPDEGNAALARRDWLTPPNGGAPKVPPCVQFSSCGGFQGHDVSKDALVFFFCPKASESESVEEILQRTETEASGLQLSVFVNPNLVDMGVTGFGMAGRLLRERLIDPLPYAYYLRTLQWGALTRVWPQEFSVWQEDENAEGGYRLIKALPQLPSNPEVEDIYDIENGLMKAKESGGILDQFGDFVNGMMRL